MPPAVAVPLDCAVYDFLSDILPRSATDGFNILVWT